ncbi:hypothetical protein CEXT_410861 [Caerostris extrusa]|uniref:Uncharacterized protein n=1 Tax=Caerostris extrusa TaxID=172846 RepID=A0AAV4V939_CAEEX|nr:hypothetical protein CEXT_410861 [Caerostris extrusa]
MICLKNPHKHVADICHAKLTASLFYTSGSTKTQLHNEKKRTKKPQKSGKLVDFRSRAGQTMDFGSPEKTRWTNFVGPEHPSLKVALKSKETMISGSMEAGRKVNASTFGVALSSRCRGPWRSLLYQMGRHG